MCEAQSSALLISKRACGMQVLVTLICTDTTVCTAHETLLHSSHGFSHVKGKVCARAQGSQLSSQSRLLLGLWNGKILLGIVVIQHTASLRCEGSHIPLSLQWLGWGCVSSSHLKNSTPSTVNGKTKTTVQRPAPSIGSTDKNLRLSQWIC